MVNWDEEDVVKWKIEARQIQQEFYERLGDREWDHIKSNEKWILEKKIGYALFGNPTEESNEDNKYGYNKKNTEEIVKFSASLRKHNGKDEFHIAFLFVYAKEHGNRFFVPMFRLKTSQGIIYIDEGSRVYKDWADFEKNNSLPKCLLCYPESGYYHACNGKVFVKFDTSPACKLGAWAVSALDTTATAITIGAVLTGIASLAIPVIAPVAVTLAQGSIGSGIYSAIRGSHHIHDRRMHKQSISLTNKDARNCWISIAGSIFGAGSGMAVSKITQMAASGKVVGKFGQLIANIFNGGSIAVNGIGIACDLCNLVEKSTTEGLTKLEVFQFTASVLFFTNTIISTKTAEAMIREVQNNVLSDFKSGLDSKRRTEAFKKVIKKGGETQQGNANVIKGIRNAENTNEFFRTLLKAQKISKTTQFVQDGKLEVKGSLFQDTGKAPLKNINDIRLTRTNVKFESTSLPTTKAKAYKDICLNIKKYVITINENIQFKFEGRVREEFSNLCYKYSISPDEDLLNKTENFAKEKECKGEKDFNDFAEFFMIYKKIQLKNKRSMFEQQKDKMMEEFGENFDESGFYKKWKIDDPDCVDIALQKLVDEEFREEELREKYDSLNEEVTAINQDGGMKFSSNLKAINNYYRSYLYLVCDLSADDFFCIIRDVVSNDAYKLHSENPNTKDKNIVAYENKEIPVTVETWQQGNEIFLYSVHFSTAPNLSEN